MTPKDDFKQFCLTNMAAARAKKFFENVAEISNDKEMGRFEKSVRLERVLHRLAYEAYQMGYNDGSNEVHSMLNDMLFTIGADSLDIMGLFDEGNSFNSDPEIDL